MIIVTGGAGFIGSNIVKGLNEAGRKDIIIVDELTDGRKFKNMVDLQIADYLDKDDFLNKIQSGYNFGEIEAIFHEGACSSTTEWNGRFMMENNYEYSKQLLIAALKQSIPFLYASSAAVYGASTVFDENPANESPLNVYGYSKLLFDNYVRQLWAQPASSRPQSQIVGFRYFNVYGPRESHKESMASVAFHHHNQLLAGDTVKLFEGIDGYGDGEQRRDFVAVNDVVNVNLWFQKHPEKSGIFNVGTGRSQSFNDVANSVIRGHGRGKIQYIPFPDSLKGRYQSFTQADITRLRDAGYDQAFKTVEEGVAYYINWLKKA